jgi:hypothetical protein
MGRCGPRPPSTCVTELPFDCSYAAVAAADGIPVTGPGWPSRLEESGVRFHEEHMKPIPEPQVLEICHRCRLVHGEAGGWMTKETYRRTTGVNPATCRLTHVYCPYCYDAIVTHSKAA